MFPLARKLLFFSATILLSFFGLQPQIITKAQDEPVLQNVYEMWVSPDGKWLAILNGPYQILVIDTASGTVRNTIDVDTSFAGDMMTSISWDPSSTQIVATDEFARVNIWNAFTSEERTIRQGGIGAAPTGPTKWSLHNQIAVVQGAAIRIFAGAPMKQLEILNDESGLLGDVDWNSDATQLAVGASKSIQIWDIETEAMINRLELPFEPAIIDWNPVITDIAVIGAPHGPAMVIDSRTGHRRFKLSQSDESTVFFLAYNADGTQIAVSDLDGIWIRDSQEGALLKHLAAGESGSIFAWTPNNDIFHLDGKGGLMLNDRPFPLK